MTEVQVDAEVVRLVTKKVNGGDMHLSERQELFKKIKGAMN
jgi:predicted chitinase